MMKKQLLKLTLIFAVLFSSSAMYSQAILWTKDAVYKIGARGTNLFMTVNPANLAVTWEEEVSPDSDTQLWTIREHRTPASSGLMEITANIFGTDVTLCIDAAEDANYPNISLKARVGLPKEVAAGDWSGYDQFQRRKTKVDANGDADSGGSNPADGNNALFIQSPTGTNSRYGVIPSAAGDAVTFDGGGIDVIDFHFVADLPAASVNTFAQDAFVIPNPINDQLVIKGATADVSSVALYSVVGNNVLSQSVNGDSDIVLNVDNLSSGVYILEIVGVRGERLTQKLVKN